MSDDAVVWKIGFGVLVLVVCGVAMTLRKEPEEPKPVPAAVSPVPAQPPVEQPPVEQPPPEAPTDAQEESPPREEVAAADDAGVQWARKPRPRAVAPSAAARVHATRAVPPRIHRVVASRRLYADSRAHYPFDPHDRWKSRF